MERFRSLEEISVSGKAVLVRGDFDVDDRDNPRTDSVRRMVEYLERAGAGKIKVIGHKGKYLVVNDLRREYPKVEFGDGLRDDGREKENSEEMAVELAEGFDVYVNEAFATSHRKHCSIVALPAAVRSRGGDVVIGMRFGLEMKRLEEVWKKPGRRVLVIGGAKVEDKEKFAELMRDKFGEILKGGLLSGVKLRPDGLDLDEGEISRYVNAIAEADVVLAAGVMGKYEDPGALAGTAEILKAIAGNKKAYKVAGGGDIERAIDMLGLTNEFDWISVGGGAMLEYLAKGTLVGIEALGD